MPVQLVESSATRSQTTDAALSGPVPRTGRRNLLLLTLLSCAYFLLFLPPNLTGAKDPDMLNAFWQDEYLQYAVVKQMVLRNGTFSETLHNFLFYDHYPYGYPFFLVSAVTAIPVKGITKLFPGVNETTAYLVVLRQLSPLFMILAILLLVYLWTGLKALGSSLFLLVFLASIPAVFDNNLWWHPDSLAVLFVVLTMLALSKDALRFGRWFYAAALFCGLATGTKWLGQFFFFTIAVYLGLGLFQQRLGFKRLLLYGCSFVFLMLLAFVVANPVLLVPEELAHMVRVLKEQVAVNSWLGTPVPLVERPLPWYTEALRDGFGFWWIYLLAACLAFFGLFSGRRTWLLNVIILTWALPTSVYLTLTMMPNARYFIPILLPLLSCLANPMTWDFKGRPMLARAAIFLMLLTLLLGSIQLANYAKTDALSYRSTATRESTSPPLRFYRELERAYLSKLPADTKLDVLCDPYTYVAPSSNVTPRHPTHWSTEYRDCEPKPDLIVLPRLYLDLYADPEVIEKQADREQARRSHAFYIDAKNNTLKGYHKVFEADYGAAFARDP